MLNNKIDKVVRILTFHSAYSYGAVLQTYALYNYLSDHYTDVRVVDFRPDYFTLRPMWNRPKTWVLCFRFCFRRNKIKYTFIISMLLFGLFNFAGGIERFSLGTNIAYALGSMSGIALAGIVILYFYNGKRMEKGKVFSKWFFYLFWRFYTQKY